LAATIFAVTSARIMGASRFVSAETSATPMPIG
jgi:hypothetical protein